MGEIISQKATSIITTELGSEFISHISYTDWGWTLIVMEKRGMAMARTYMIDDDENLYFDWLSVDVSARNTGLGTKLLMSHIKAANELKLNSALWVVSDSWMHNWYKRVGYVDGDEYEEENATWMNLKYKENDNNSNM